MDQNFRTKESIRANLTEIRFLRDRLFTLEEENKRMRVKNRPEFVTKIEKFYSDNQYVESLNDQNCKEIIRLVSSVFLKGLHLFQKNQRTNNQQISKR